jgi:hypothetical protein
LGHPHLIYGNPTVEIHSWVKMAAFEFFVILNKNQGLSKCGAFFLVLQSWAILFEDI